MQAFVLDLQRLNIRLPGFARAAYENRRMLIAGAVSVSLLSIVVTLTAMQSLPSCATGQNLLVYPLYDRKGIVVDTRALCGIPHRGCTQRLGEVTTYDCSPFMAPKGSLTQR